MSHRDSTSDELINAFVDGELGAEERVELLRATRRSEALRQRICEAAYLKSLVQQACPLPAMERQEAGHSPERRAFLTYAAAAVMGGVGVSAALYRSAGPTGGAGSVEAVEEAAATVTGRGDRVVFHISSDAAGKAELLLDQVALVLARYAEGRRPLKVEVIANNQGLRMLQLGRSPVAGRIRRLDRAYPNLTFAACGNTLQRLRRESKENIELLPEAVIVQSGISFVARRQQEGWAYIKV